jgi:hypothetical protein
MTLDSEATQEPTHFCRSLALLSTLAGTSGYLAMPLSVSVEEGDRQFRVLNMRVVTECGERDRRDA